MSFNFIVPQSPAGAVPALYYVPPSVLQYQQPPPNTANVTAYRQFFGKSSAVSSFLHPKFKTEICNKYDSKYGCPYGEQCQFRHPEDPTPPETIFSRMSQMAASEGSNSVSSNTSINAPVFNRNGRFGSGRSHLSSTESRDILQNKAIFRPQNNNGRQFLKTKGNIPCSPLNRRSRNFSVSEDKRTNDISYNCSGNNGVNGNKSITRPYLGKSPSTALSFLHPKFKTEVCNKYSSKFGCPYGEQCQFRHPEDPTTPEAVMARMSQVTISEGSNSVSSVTSVNGCFVNRVKSFGERNHINSSGDCRGVFTGKTAFRVPYNGRQVLKTKGNSGNVPFNNYSIKTFTDSKNENTVNNNENKSFFNEKTLPNFLKFVNKVPKNGMRRFNSQDTIGVFTYAEISKFKKIYH